MPAAAQQEAAARAAKYRSQMALDELRTARQLTQEALAGVLRVKQSTISKIERRTDMYLSTLISIIKAMGGELRLEAVFPDGTVEIDQFKKELRGEREGQSDHKEEKEGALACV